MILSMWFGNKAIFIRCVCPFHSLEATWPAMTSSLWWLMKRMHVYSWVSKTSSFWESLEVQRLGVGAFTTDSPAWETKISPSLRHGQKKKKGKKRKKKKFSFIFLHCCCPVAQSCPTLFDLTDCGTPGFPFPYHLPEFDHVPVHWVSDAIQPSHPLLSPSPPAFNRSQHQGLFSRVSSSHQVAKVLELQHQSFQ